jgi:nucleotide-binding universal stress UspA family protein
VRDGTKDAMRAGGGRDVGPETWEQIVRTARTNQTDLLVMGTHGRTGWAKFFLGSVASRVVASAPCPVLT